MRGGQLLQQGADPPAIEPVLSEVEHADQLVRIRLCFGLISVTKHATFAFGGRGSGQECSQVLGEGLGFEIAHGVVVEVESSVDNARVDGDVGLQVGRPRDAVGALARCTRRRDKQSIHVSFCRQDCFC